MCRAVTVLCVADDPESLSALKHAAVGAEWELTDGATSAEEALLQLGDTKAHVLVVWGDHAELVRAARRRFPGVRIVADTGIPEANVVVASLGDVREAIRGLPRPGGPVRA